MGQAMARGGSGSLSARMSGGGSGVAELSMSILYSKFVPPVLLGPLVILWRAATYFSNIIVGAAFAGASLNGMVKKDKSKI